MLGSFTGEFTENLKVVVAIHWSTSLHHQRGAHGQLQQVLSTASKHEMESAQLTAARPPAAPQMRAPARLVTARDTRVRFIAANDDGVFIPDLCGGVGSAAI
jgi:hypothetical protein